MQHWLRRERVFKRKKEDLRSTFFTLASILRCSLILTMTKSSLSRVICDSFYAFFPPKTTKTKGHTYGLRKVSKQQASGGGEFPGDEEENDEECQAQNVHQNVEKGQQSSIRRRCWKTGEGGGGGGMGEVEVVVGQGR